MLSQVGNFGLSGALHTVPNLQPDCRSSGGAADQQDPQAYSPLDAPCLTWCHGRTATPSARAQKCRARAGEERATMTRTVQQGDFWQRRSRRAPPALERRTHIAIADLLRLQASSCRQRLRSPRA